MSVNCTPMPGNSKYRSGFLRIQATLAFAFIRSSGRSGSEKSTVTSEPTGKGIALDEETSPSDPSGDAFKLLAVLGAITDLDCQGSPRVSAHVPALLVC